MTTRVIALATAVALNLCLGTSARAQSANTLSDAEKQQGWDHGHAIWFRNIKIREL